MISHPTWYCFKIWKKCGNKLKSDIKQARGAGSTDTIPIHDLDPDNKTRILLLPGGKLHKATIISSHTSPSIGWLEPAKVIPEWII